MTKMNKILLTIVLAIATLAAVPASAGPYCQEDLGYGRTSSFGAAAKALRIRCMPRPHLAVGLLHPVFGSDRNA
jgi:hypothetical protein